MKKTTNFFAKLFDLFIAITTIGIPVGYIIIIGDLLPSVLVEWIPFITNDSFFIKNVIWT